MPPVKLDDFKLIELVKQNTHLYDKNDAEYRDLAKKSITWKAIGVALGASADLCRKRFRCLRDRFNKEKKVRKSDMLDDPKMPLVFKKMIFLWDHLVHRNYLNDNSQPEVVEMTPEMNEEVAKQVRILNDLKDYGEPEQVIDENMYDVREEIIYTYNESQDESNCSSERYDNIASAYVETELELSSCSTASNEKLTAIEEADECCTDESQNSTDDESVDSAKEVGTSDKVKEVETSDNETLKTGDNEEKVTESVSAYGQTNKSNSCDRTGNVAQSTITSNPITPSNSEVRKIPQIISIFPNNIVQQSNRPLPLSLQNKRKILPKPKISSPIVQKRVKVTGNLFNRSNQTPLNKIEAPSKACNEAYCKMIKQYLDKMTSPERLSAARLQILTILHNELYSTYKYD